MKSRLSRKFRFLAVLIACLQLTRGVAQEGQRDARPVVQKIRISHVGPPAVSDELVRANLRLREGDEYSRVSVDDDIQNLHGTGYFYNVQVREEATEYQKDAQGNVLRDLFGRPIPKTFSLTYVVQGKPLLTEIRFTGNKKYGNSKLLKKVTSKVGEPLNEQKLFSDSQEILKLYQKAGLHKTKVEYRPVINDNLGRGTVTFEIVEAPKIKIDDVVFENATAFKQRKLRWTIKTRRRWMFSWLTGSGKLKDEQFEDDKEKLREFYADNGYVDFELRNVLIDPGAKTNHIVLKLDVDEGKQYKVGGVTFKGNELFTDEELRNKPMRLNTKYGEKPKPGIRLKEGAVFSPSELSKDVEALTDLYGSLGFVDARVVPQKNANIELGTMDVVHNINEGERAYIEKIEIKGNTKTKDKVIRRELAITPGEAFDTVKVKISKNRLEQMSYFEKVETTPEPTDVPNRKNLLIGVEEKNTGNLAVGAGFSSIDALVGFVEVSQGNFDLFNFPYFTGGGQKARLRVQYGSRRQDYVATFVEPWFLGRRLELTTEIYHRDLSYLSDNYEQQQTGARFALRRALPKNFEVGTSYTIESINLELSDDYRNRYTNSIILSEEGRRLVSRWGAMVAHDTRNNFQLASRGHRAELSGDVAGGIFGGDTDFYRLELRASQYFNPNEYFTLSSGWEDFFQGHVLEVGGRVGVVAPYGDGDTRRVNGQTVNTPDRVPLFDRYFLGGLYSLRGFRYRAVGPRELDSNEPVGGNTYWFGTVEYSIPLIERLRFAVFYDAGMVYADSYSFSTLDPKTGEDYGTRFYNDNWGVGLRLNLPIGPLRLDYGIPINHGRGVSGSGKFQFGVGWNREF